MKLLKTIERIVEEAKSNYEEACEKGVKQEKIDLLEKRYFDSLRLMKLYSKIGKKLEKE